MPIDMAISIISIVGLLFITIATKTKIFAYGAHP
jgi:hypothetical protein